MARATVVGLLALISPAFAADDVILRHMDTVLDFVGLTSASCVQHYEEGMTPKARAELHFSQEEIVAYCVCSTKLLVREMGESDFRNLEAGNDLPMTFAPQPRRHRAIARGMVRARADVSCGSSGMRCVAALCGERRTALW
jgi:hypothetical protein